MRKSTARQAAKGCNSAAAAATTKSNSDLGSIAKVKGASRRGAVAVVKAIAGQHHGQPCEVGQTNRFLGSVLGKWIAFFMNIYCDEYLVKIHLPLVSKKTSVENQDWKGRRGKILLVVFLLKRRRWVLKFIGIFRFKIHYD
jgi:hypothetical protein